MVGGKLLQSLFKGYICIPVRHILNECASNFNITGQHHTQKDWAVSEKYAALSYACFLRSTSHCIQWGLLPRMPNQKSKKGRPCKIALCGARTMRQDRLQEALK